MIQQSYIQNTTKAYPLVDDSMLNNYLVDLAISTPVDINPIISAITIQGTSVFIALEDSITKTGLGHLQVNNTKKYSPYVFTTIVPEIYAWCVFGEIRNTTDVYLVDQIIEIDPTTVTKIPNTSGIDTLTVNGNSIYKSGNLILKSTSAYLDISLDEAIVDGISRECITLSRNDTNISLDVLYNKLKTTVSANTRIYSIAGVTPNLEGNINIQADAESSTFTSVPIREVSDNSDIGILFNETAELCKVDCPECIVKHGPCELGINTDGLPCDTIIEALHPEFLEPDCGCE